MDKNNRQFSIPYNTKFDPYSYINVLERYKGHIENVFVGLSDLLHSHDDSVYYDKMLDSTKKKLCDNAYAFLDRTRGLFKRIIPINSMVYNEPAVDFYNRIEETIYPKIEKYEIDGIICSHYSIAKHIKRDFPNIELHSSCNALQFTLRNMDLWANIGCTIFNPPREAGRMPRLLKEMHDAGFKLKVLVNEACLFGCPNLMSHCQSVSLGNSIIEDMHCRLHEDINALKTNLVLPEWLDDLDEYCDVYKLQGRSRFDSLPQIIKSFDAYILNSPYTMINELTPYNTYDDLFASGLSIPAELIPSKLKDCECRYCNKGCSECKKAWEKIKEYNKNNRRI